MGRIGFMVMLFVVLATLLVANWIAGNLSAWWALPGAWLALQAAFALAWSSFHAVDRPIWTTRRAPRGRRVIGVMTPL